MVANTTSVPNMYCPLSYLIRETKVTTHLKGEGTVEHWHYLYVYVYEARCGFMHAGLYKHYIN